MLPLSASHCTCRLTRQSIGYGGLHRWQSAQHQWLCVQDACGSLVWVWFTCFLALCFSSCDIFLLTNRKILLALGRFGYSAMPIWLIAHFSPSLMVFLEPTRRLFVECISPLAYKYPLRSTDIIIGKSTLHSPSSLGSRFLILVPTHFVVLDRL